MTKSDLIQRLSKMYPQLYLRDIERIVNSIFSEITQSHGHVYFEHESAG